MGRLNESARIRARHYHRVKICENISFSHLNEDYYSYFCPAVKPTTDMRRMHAIRL